MNDPEILSRNYATLSKWTEVRDKQKRNDIRLKWFEY